MASLFQSLRWVHIAAGSVALIVFWIPAIARKGGRTHVRAGWVYVVCMSVVVVTAFALSGLVFSDPVAIRGVARPLSPAELSDFLRRQRIFATFLAYLAGVTLASGWQGIWAAETKREPSTMRTPFSLTLNVAIILGGLAVFILGIKYGNGPLISLSPLGPFIGGANLRYLLRGPKTPMHWWYEHLGSMVGTGIAGYTAFLVFGGSRLFPALGRTQMRTLFWVLPTLDRRAYHLRDGCLLPTQIQRDPPCIGRFLTTHRATSCGITPSLWQKLGLAEDGHPARTSPTDSRAARRRSGGG
jgi:hypothetical protein